MPHIYDHLHFTSAAIKALLLLLFLALPYKSGSAFLTATDSLLHDSFMRWRNRIFTSQPVSREIVLIGIDDRTNRDLGAYGKGEWTARLPFVRQMAVFRELKPKLVAYDISFIDPLSEDIRSDHEFLRDRQVSGDIARVLTAFEHGEELQALSSLKYLSLVGNLIGDQAMALQLSMLTETVPVILAYHLPLKDENQTRPWQPEDILGLDKDRLSEENGLLLPYLRDVGIPLVQAKNLPDSFAFIEFQAKLPNRDLLDFAQLGHINVPRDSDGVVRRIPLVLGVSYSFADPETGKNVSRRFLVPSMALLTCIKNWGIPVGVDFIKDPTSESIRSMEIRFGEYILLRQNNGRNTRIPIDMNGCMRLDFTGAILDYDNVSFSVANTVEAQALIEDKIVFVGVCATGAGDVGPVPIDDNAALVLTHMTAVSNILTGTFIREFTPRKTAVLLVLVWGLLSVSGFFVRLKWFVIIAAATALAWVISTYIGIHIHAYLLPFSLPMFYLLSASIGHGLIQYFAEEKEKQRVRGMFQTMVSTDVLHYMEENPGSFSLAGEQRQATILFSDVAGFTSISESLSPEKLVKLLNAYLTPMTEIILGHQGYLDKYEGDAIMAEWGVPYPNQQHAQLACFAALEQQQVLDEMREDLYRRFGHRLHVRMGLNSGLVSAGNMGSTNRFSYTVMGDAVNQAARFEPANKDYGTLIMIGAVTYELAREHIEVRMLDKLVVKGKTEPILVYELIGRRGDIMAEKAIIIANYEEALQRHWQRDFKGALDMLAENLLLDPNDGPSLNLRRRLEDYLLHPPEDNWRGEFVRQGKD